MFKKCQVVLLKTNQKNEIGKFSINFNRVEGESWLSAGTVLREPYNLDHQNFHLYILSDDDITIGDFRYLKTTQDVSVVKETHFVENSKYWKEYASAKKVIATTDPELNLPNITQQFINKYVESYNKDSIIENIEVEYEYETVVKVIDNTINIKSIKKTFSREEVYELLFQALTEDGPGAFNMGWDSSDAQEWIENNL